jgi:hypothetical protein
MQDFNGLLNQITAWSRWQAAAGLAAYDNTFSTAIGGYPSGATVLSASLPGRVWISTADNNTTNPDTGSAANWLALMLASDVLSIIPTSPAAGTRGVITFAASQTWNVPATVYFLKRVTVWGAGGGGGGSAGSTGAGSGGGGGGYQISFNIPVTPGQQIAITIGAGGLGGGAGAQIGNGAPGGTTSFGAFFSILGGGAGSAGNNGGQYQAAGAGGAVGSGNVNVAGTNGGLAFTIGTTPVGGIGGAAAFGGGSPSLNIGTAGSAGNFPGGGGNAGSAGGYGGQGAGAFIIVEY